MYKRGDFSFLREEYTQLFSDGWKAYHSRKVQDMIKETGITKHVFFAFVSELQFMGEHSGNSTVELFNQMHLAADGSEGWIDFLKWLEDKKLVLYTPLHINERRRVREAIHYFSN